MQNRVGERVEVIQAMMKIVLFHFLKSELGEIRFAPETRGS